MRATLTLLLLLTPMLARAEERLRTVAESSDFKRTSTHAQVMGYCVALEKKSDLVRRTRLGKSKQGKDLPFLILSDPPIRSAAEAEKSGKPVVLVLGNIHAGEVAGKEGVLMLARDLVNEKSRLLKELVLLVAPIFNADGNDDMAKENRPGQNGPERMGTRHNAQGLDLNRDFVKLESPEVRALVSTLTKWDPAVFIDLHTTNGSRHRYTLTYDGPRHPAGDERIINMVRDRMLPAVGERLRKRSGYRSFYYGNFAHDRKAWATYPALPRYGIAYVGLRNRISILSEAYSYAPYKDRVLASRDFVRSCLEEVVARKKQITALLRRADQETVEAGRAPRADDQVALRIRPAALDKPFDILGFVEEEKEGKRIVTDKPKTYSLPFEGLCELTRSAPRPFAYLIPPEHKEVLAKLEDHGIRTETVPSDMEMSLEVHRIDKVRKALRPFQKHLLTLVETTTRSEKTTVNKGTVMVRTAQPLGNLVVYLLEPEAEDGFVAWNFFEVGVKEGTDFPVRRVTKPVGER